MKAKQFTFLAALFVFAVAGSIGSGVAKAAGQPPMQQKGKGTAAPVVKPEDEAYKAFFNSRTGTPETQISLGEDFIKKYPQSNYLGAVYAQLTSAYFAVGNEDKMFDVGGKAVDLNPDNVDVLALLAMAMPRRVKANTPDGAQQLIKAEAYARRAIELIPNLPKPDAVDDATFTKAKNEKLAMAHSGLGLIDIDHSKFEDARTELMQAVQLSSSPDPVDYFLLGNADSQASYYNDAAAAYDKCAAAGPLMAQCKARADAARKDATTKMGR